MNNIGQIDTQLKEKQNELRALGTAAKSEKRSYNPKELEVRKQLQQEITELRNQKISFIAENGEKIKLTEESQMKNEQRANFKAFLKNGEIRELNSTNGAVIIPTVVADEIYANLGEIAPLYALAEKIPTTGKISFPRVNVGRNAAAIAEGAEAPEGTLSITEVTLDAHRIGEYFELTEELLANSPVADRVATQTLAEEVAIAVEAEMINGTTFAGGLATDVDSPKVEVAALTVDNVVDTAMLAYNKLKTRFISGAVFTFSQAAYDLVSTAKDGNGHYFIQNGVVNGKPTRTLFGVPVHVSENMPETVPFFLSNVAEAYKLATKDNGFTLSRDVDAVLRRAGKVQFYGATMLDGAVVKPEAVVRVVISA